MKKLLIGGSPCTFWSTAQKNNRETEACGIGWELFKNYLIAKEKFSPDFFLYENNKSVSQPIKDQISKELGVDLMHINSALVSAQNRQRFYAFNWEVEQPEDRCIVLRDILETPTDERTYKLKNSNRPELVCQWGKYATGKGQQGMRAYSVNGKSCTIRSSGAEMIAEPIRIENVGGIASASRGYSCDGKSVYEVKKGLITIKGKTYPIKIDDGHYIIRKLTPTECERLQTLPDGYTKAVSNAQRIKGLGNGWTADVIIHILQGALKDVPKDEEIVVLSMYDGIGTGRYCLDKMGFTNVKYFAYEIDKYAKQIALSNYPDIIQMGDAFDVRHPDWTILNSKKEG